MDDPIIGKPIKYHPLRNFVHAFRGILYALSFEMNLWIQIFIGIISTLTFLYYEKLPYAIISLVGMFLVSALELTNTAFEHLCDIVDTRYNLRIKRIKDVSAGSVLFAAIGWGMVIIYGMAQIFFNLKIY